MNRRKALSLATLSTLAWAITPLSAQMWQPHQDVSDNKDPWKAETSTEAIKLLYPDKELLTSDKIYVKAPKLASGGHSIPIHIRTDIEAKKIILLQDANPSSLVGIFEVPKDELVDYSLRIKMRQTEYMTVLIEDINGMLYLYRQKIEIGLSGGCGG